MPIKTPIKEITMNDVDHNEDIANGHRLTRFQLIKGTENSRLGREWTAYCRFCDQTVSVFPQWALPHRDYAFVRISQCGHRQRSATYLIHAVCGTLAERKMA